MNPSDRFAEADRKHRAWLDDFIAREKAARKLPKKEPTPSPEHLHPVAPAPRLPGEQG